MSSLAGAGRRSSSAAAAAAAARHTHSDTADTTSRREGDTAVRREATAQSCATDALHVIFSSLPLCDVASCAASCRRWAAAAAAGSGVGRHRIDVRLHTLRALATSPLRILVGEINLAGSTLVAADRVESVWSAFPHLTALTCCVEKRLLTPDTELRFPMTLRALDISDDADPPNWRSIPWSSLDVLLSLAVRSPLTRLRVSMHSNHHGTPPTSTIERLLTLRDTIVDLELGVKGTGVSCAWRADDIAVFRSLPHLTRLDVAHGSWAAEEIDLLTAHPTPHRLCSIDIKATTEPAAQSLVLSRVTSLSSLRVGSMRCDPAPLAQMTHLRTLCIDNCGGLAQATRIAQAIARCSALTDLTLTTVTILSDATASWMRLFLPTLRLRRLQIAWMPVDIECGAAASHLADTLEELIVDTAQPLSSLRHLRSLRRLRSLRIDVDLSSDSGETIGWAEEDDETVSLPDLEHLELITRHEGDDGLDLGRFFGRMPALRRAKLRHQRGVTSTQTIKMIKRMPYITVLKLEERCMQSEELSEVLPSLLCLRELTLTTYAGRDLTFLSSPSSGHHLCRTLERLTIIATNEHVSPLDLRHLHSLGALQYLNLDLRLHTRGDTTGVMGQSPADSPRGLASLRELRVQLTRANGNIDLAASLSEEPATRPTVDLGRLFGPMPQLRTATIECDTIIAPATIADALAHSTRLTELTLWHNQLTDVHLAAVVRPLARLRLLRVDSSAIATLAFLSAPHLASTIQELYVHPSTDSTRLPPASELHHLRGLAHLRSLSVDLGMRRDDLSDRIARDEYESPRRDLWPHMHEHYLSFKGKQVRR